MSTESTTKTAVPLVFGDTETTGLDPFMHDAWEHALIVRRPGEPDQEHVFRLQPDLANADPKALEINRYHERTAAADWQWDDPHYAAVNMYRLLNGAILIGSNPAFDADMWRNLFARYYDNAKPWHYRTVDIATLAAGFRYGQASTGVLAGGFAIPGDYPQHPYSSYGLSRAVGVEPPAKDVAHTALGDARWAKAVYDRISFPYRGGHGEACAYAGGISSQCTCVQVGGAA